MARTPLISVIMSVHNHQAYLGEAVESVLAQTFADWELILIDNGSTDRCPDMIDAFAAHEPRIVPIHQRDIGLPAARNRGVGMARGPWIAYLDSDDRWFPHTLSAYADWIGAHPATQFLYGFAHRLVGNRVTKLPGRHQDRPIGTRELFQRIFLMPLAVCHRRELWVRAGRFDPELRWCDDYDLFLRMSLHGSMEPINRPLGLRRRHDSNMSARSGRSQQVEAQVLHRFIERNCRPLLGDPAIVQRLGQVYARAARCYFRERKFPEALAMAQQAQVFSRSLRNRAVAWVSRWMTRETDRRAG